MVGAPQTRVVWILLSFLFFSPLFVLLYHLWAQDISVTPQALDFDEIFWALKNSVKLGVLSSLGSVVLGFFLALGLNYFIFKSPSSSGYLKQALLFPIYLPPFFVILTFFYWIDFAPLGIYSSTLAQVLTYAGFAGVLISGFMSEHLKDLAELASIQGLSRHQFFWWSRGLLFRPILALAIFVFAVSFTSFSIPLVLGGGKGTTLEILIYEKIKISQDFGLALWLSLLQSIVIGILFWKMPMQFSVSKARGSSNSILFSPGAALLLVLFLIFQFFPWVGQSPGEWVQGWRQLSEAPGFWAELISAGSQSLLLAFESMVLVFLLILLFARLLVSSNLPWLLRSYFPLSVSLLGLTGILLSPAWGSSAAYLYCFVLLIFPSLYRLGLDSKLEALRGQIQISQVLGASEFQTLWRVVFPQMRPEISGLLGMAFLWTLGDFAVAKFFLPTNSTLTLMIENLMTSYRIQGALMLGLAVLLAGGFMQLLLWKVFDVHRSQS